MVVMACCLLRAVSSLLLVSLVTCFRQCLATKGHVYTPTWRVAGLLQDGSCPALQTIFPLISIAILLLPSGSNSIMQVEELIPFTPTFVSFMGRNYTHPIQLRELTQAQVNEFLEELKVCRPLLKSFILS